MRLLIMTIFAASLLAAQTPSGNAQNGRKLFESYGCYQCHGHEAQGGLGTGPRLGPKPIPFTAFQRYVRQPAAQMPPYTAKVVSDKDLADIYAFLQSVKQPPAVKDIPLLKN
jgi:mono/diheme cytochrome c family protein